MIIRLAGKGDIAGLAEIEREHSDYPAWGEKGIAAEFEKNFSVTLAAENENGLKGFVNFWILNREVQLNAVVVSKKCSGEKIGSGLINKMLEYVKNIGCKIINLEVNRNNAPAIGLYKKFGFKITGLRPKFYNNSDDAILMRKTVPGTEY